MQLTILLLCRQLQGARIQLRLEGQPRIRKALQEGQKEADPRYFSLTERCCGIEIS